MNKKGKNIFKWFITILNAILIAAVLSQDDSIRSLLKGSWPVIKWYLIVMIVITPILAFIDKRSGGKVFNFVMIKVMGAIVYKVFPMLGTVLTMMFVFLVLVLIPQLLLFAGEHFFFWKITRELHVYLVITFISIAVTFLSSKSNTLSSKYVMDNPAGISGNYLREDLIKPIFYGINVLLVIASGILKYDHLTVSGFSDTSMDPFVQAFVTFIAFDSFVFNTRAIRSAKELKSANQPQNDDVTATR